MEGLEPLQIIELVKHKYGVTVCRKSIYTYEKSGAISPALFRNSRTAIYPPVVVDEVYYARCPHKWKERALAAEQKLREQAELMESPGEESA